MADNVELDSQKLDANGDVIQTNEENPSGQSTQTPEELAKVEADKLLQAEYTRTRQALIDNTKKLVEKDGSEIHNIQDPKLRDSVSRAIFNMGYAEAEAVFGKGFTKTKEDDESSGTEEIQKELRLLKYREQERDIDIAINNLKSTSPQMFQGVSDMESKIREELSNIVTTLPIDERVRRAANNAFGSALDPTTLAYKVLNNKNSGVNGGASKGAPSEGADVSDAKAKEAALKSYMGNILGIKNK